MKILNPMNYLKWAAVLLILSLAFNPLYSQENSYPNIVIIITDDQGYADISFNPEHPTEVSTPHMDALANEGIFFSQAYISGNVCSPTRAGLMTGRYQQREGVYTAGEGGTGMDPAVPIFPAFLKSRGYVSGAFGKWHLGIDPEHNPIPRGFDEFFGFMGRGAHDYYDLDDTDHPLYRGTETTTAEGYLTNILTDEAVSFIKNHKDEPFFCYLAYNAVHTPMQAPAEDIADFNTGDPTRDILMAMLRHLDNGVGEVVNTLKEEGIWDNTLLFFLTDNGGAGATHANNAPLRGFKNQNWEGGIRTPFVLSWPEAYEGNRIIHTPIISLDILPTVLDALDIDEPEDPPFDGKSILPVIENEDTIHHDFMFWTEGGDRGEWAVRYKHWKLVVVKDQFHLSDLDTDVSESTNLINIYPDTADLMIAEFLEWLNDMADPMQESGKAWIPKISAGQLASLYDRLYFRGNVQHFDKLGTYNPEALSGIGEDNTRSILLADGISLKAYSEPDLKGDDSLVDKSIPYLKDLGNGLSSFNLFSSTLGRDVSDVEISASSDQETVDNTRDDDYTSYWESTTQGSWIRYEFCQNVRVNGIRIAFKRGDLREAFFNVESSLDGETWTPLITNGVSSGTSRNLEYFPFPTADAKFIRIIGYGNSDNDQNHYTEVKFDVLGMAGDEMLIKAEDYNSVLEMAVTSLDDCAGFNGITNTASNAEAAYNFEIPEGNYLLNLRVKAMQSASLHMYINNLLQGSISLTDELADNSWRDLSLEVSVPEGDNTLKITYSKDNSVRDLELNWYRFAPSASMVATISRSLIAYPNPCFAKLSIQSDDQISMIEIYDQSGRRILQHYCMTRKVILPLAHLEEGLYIARVNGIKKTEYIRFVKSS